MKKTFLLLTGTLIGASLFAQAPNLDSWILNTTGKTSSYWENTAQKIEDTPNYVYRTSTTQADVTSACYTQDSIYIKSEGMTNDMGQFRNAGSPSGQGYVFSFPRNPVAGSGSSETYEVGSIGVLLNGIPMYGLSDGTSYDPMTNSKSNMGAGIWVGDAYASEGYTLDTAFAAHPQQQGAYHSHATPFRLYTDPSGGAHSPIVGYAHDGFPVYGPFGYANPNNTSSPIVRMTSSYQLRNITVRTTLPDGSNSMPPGPAVTSGGSFDLGTYIQDYEYVQGLGKLDEHNGRFCITPEYPAGTYAYFVTVDANGTPIFPYYIGTTYYGTPVASNNLGLGTQPSSGTTCLPLVTGVRKSDFLSQEVNVYPNPASESFTIVLPEDANGLFDIRVVDNTGKLVQSLNMVDANQNINVDVSRLTAGVYTVRIIGYNQLFTSEFVKQ